MTEAVRPARRQLRRPGVRRGIVHKVTVTEDQEAVLVAAAADRGWTISRLLVESATAGGADRATARADLAGEMFRLTRMLGQVGNNVNQLARAANASGQVPTQLPPALDALTRTCARLDAFLDQLGAPGGRR